ncbi:quinone-dependent dihydroorotate dehydrogenase [Candidatus Peregrinibacteria bacterium]|nr:quinone-dependent dihydroorotate dehydrogenase [Candidatus Peregrinibacteria bacterium]
MIKETVINIRNKIFKFFYKFILKPILFQMDPETVHDGFTFFGKILGSNIVTRKITELMFAYSNKMLNQRVLNMDFKNPIGMAAGFDKDVNLTDILPSVGFGFAEVGSITGEKCEGNPKPRLWRLKKSKGLVVYYGLKNDGCEKIARKIKDKKFKIPIGVSVAKTNCKETADLQKGIDDYSKAYNTLKEFGSYMTINISCPNAFGGQPFTDANSLSKLLDEIKKHQNEKPIFLKLPPDLPTNKLDEIIETASKYKVSGFICANLTKDKHNKEINARIIDKDIPKVGGISGKPVEELADEVIKYVYKKTNGKYVIIGCGGVFSAKDAYKKIRLGASLIQMITGMIFEGPEIISEINLGLVKLLKRDGFKNISEAIGIDNK